MDILVPGKIRLFILRCLPTRKAGKSLISIISEPLCPKKFAGHARRELAREFGYEEVMPTGSFGGYDTIIEDNQTPGTILTNASVSPCDRQALFDVVTDPYFGTVAITRYVFEKGLDLERCIDISSDETGATAALDLDELIPATEFAETGGWRILEYDAGVKVTLLDM
jgi:hypothetical protein